MVLGYIGFSWEHMEIVLGCGCVWLGVVCVSACGQRFYIALWAAIPQRGAPCLAQPCHQLVPWVLLRAIALLVSICEFCPGPRSALLTFRRTGWGLRRGQPPQECRTGMGVRTIGLVGRGRNWATSRWRVYLHWSRTKGGARASRKGAPASILLLLHPPTFCLPLHPLTISCLPLPGNAACALE